MISALFSSIGGMLTEPSVSMVLLLVKATLILLVAIGITLTMQRTSAGARHLVWLVTLAALLLVPGLTAWAPLSVKVLPAPATRVPTAPITRNASPATFSTLEVGAQPSIATNSDAPNALAADPRVSNPPVLSGLSMIFLVWAAVMLLIAASLGYAAMMVRRIVIRARPLDTEDWLTPLFEVSDRLSLDEPPRLLRSEDAKMPFACGVFNPTIVLPAECDGWSLDRRRAVLLHELAHVRRHDLVGHTLGRLACAVYWFHPLVWTAAKQLRSESERACDDLALACGARATDYAEHLLDIVTSVRRDATPSVALAMARRKEFEGRMLAILDPELRHVSPSRRQSAALIGSLALISIVVGAAAPAPRATAVENHSSASAPTIVAPKAAVDPASLQIQPVDLASSQAQQAVKDYPDSVEMALATKTRQLTRTLTKQTERTVSDVVESVVRGASSSLSSAAILGALRAGTLAQKTDTDERPVLLARILATDSSASLRRVAAWGLAEYADTQVAIDALANALRRDPDARVREMAAWALAEGERSSTGVQALSAALHGDANVQVRATAAWALGNVGDRSAVDALSASLTDASPQVRTRAVWALGNIDLRQAPPALIAMLNDKDPQVRELTAWALYEIEDPASITALQAALTREPSKDLQIAYIRALASVGERSVDALKGLLESRDPEIRSIAVRALAGGNATGPWPRPWPEPRPFPN